MKRNNLQLEKYVERKYLVLYKKYLVSKFWYISLNILSALLIALMIILNIYALRKNKVPDTKIYFVAIAILSGFIAMLLGLSGFFVLKKNANSYKENYLKIIAEEKQWKAKEDEYKKENRDEILISKILEITSE